MPRMVPIPASEIPALLALRRTLWQLAALGVAIAMTLARLAPHFGAFPIWCVLVPASALAVHYRQELSNALLAHRQAAIVRRRISRQRPQARRAASGRASAKPQLARSRHAMG